MTAILICLGVFQVNVIESDNASIIACLNGQLAGKPTKCLGLSSVFAKDLSVNDANPGLYFTLLNNERRNEIAAVWKYQTPEQKDGVLKATLSKLVIPFKEWTVANNRLDITNNPFGTVRIINRIDGINDNFDSIVVGINFSTGRITTVSFEMRSEILRESETITDQKVFDRIREDGAIYDIINDNVSWNGLTFKTPEMLGRQGVVNANGKVILVKQRSVVVKRNSDSKRYVFRMDGSLLFSE